MSLIVNGVEVQAINVVQGGVTTALNELVCNGVTVWQGTKWNVIAEGAFAHGARQTSGTTTTGDITASDMGLSSFDTSLPTRITGVCKVGGSVVGTFTETVLPANGSYVTLCDISAQTFKAQLYSAGSAIRLQIYTNTTKVVNLTVTKVEQYY